MNKIAWIKAFADELSRLRGRGSMPYADERAADLWPTEGDEDPIEAARVEWNGWAPHAVLSQ